MKLEAVIVCVDYSDFLNQTLDRNLEHFDDIVVVTKESDKKTRHICDKHCVRTVLTNVFHENGDKFNKGRAINLGLCHLRHDDWLIHLDADIVLSDRFRTKLEMARLKKDTIYGSDRINCIGYENWLKIKNNHQF